jgi:hypothetical protein
MRITLAFGLYLLVGFFLVRGRAAVAGAARNLSRSASPITPITPITPTRL